MLLNVINVVVALPATKVDEAVIAVVVEYPSQPAIHMGTCKKIEVGFDNTHCFPGEVPILICPTDCPPEIDGELPHCVKVGAVEVPVVMFPKYPRLDDTLTLAKRLLPVAFVKFK